MNINSVYVVVVNGSIVAGWTQYDQAYKYAKAHGGEIKTVPINPIKMKI